MLLDVTRFAEAEFAHSVDGSDQDQQASNVDDDEQSLPSLKHLPLEFVDRAVLIVGVATDSMIEFFGKAARGEVEADGDDAEEAETRDLHAETNQHDCLATVEFFFGVGVS